MDIQLRAGALIVAIGGLFIACVASTQRDRVRRTESPLTAASCLAQPWLPDAHVCGEPTLETHRVTCEDLGFVDASVSGRNVTIEHFESDTAGFLDAAFSFEDGFLTSVYTQTNAPRPALATWGLTTNVKDDGGTMTVDAIIFSGTTASGEASLVYRFAPPEFYVRDMSEAFVTRDIQVCGYRFGQAGGLPPPPPDAGDVTLDCASLAVDGGVPGSTSLPGPSITSVDAIAYTVTVSPAPTNGSLLGIKAFVGADDFGTAFRTLHNGQLAGGYDSELAPPATNGTLEMRFIYLGRSCSLYWTLGESDGGVSDGGVKTW
jgi:hypothetical protein